MSRQRQSDDGLSLLRERARRRPHRDAHIGQDLSFSSR
jgi:hypothetical protein